MSENVPTSHFCVLLCQTIQIIFLLIQISWLVTYLSYCTYYIAGADLGVGPEGHRPLLKSDWPLKCPCPVSHRWFTSSSLLAASVRRLKINLLNGFCLQLLVLCFQFKFSFSNVRKLISSGLGECPIASVKATLDQSCQLSRFRRVTHDFAYFHSHSRHISN